MVVLSRIYTRTGDGGDTRLSDMSTTRKSDPRVAAYGDVDETNSAIGVALAQPGIPDPIVQVLARVQNELFDVGADLSTPLADQPKYPPLRIDQAAVDRLEHWCDEFGDPLPTLRSFILPGGTPAGAALHLARTLCRRAERSAWLAVEAHGTDPAAEGADRAGGVNPVAITYLNRLSDLLFICARAVNGTTGEVLWVPGAERTNRGNADRSPEAPAPAQSESAPESSDATER